MFQIVYFSSAAARQEATVIQDILLKARANNLRDGISGLLVAGGNRYFQVIEGPRRAMEALYANIRADHRHFAVTTLIERTTLARCFEGWTMAYRREPRLGGFDNFAALLRHLTEKVDDQLLRGQLLQFSRTFIEAPPPDGGELRKLAS